MREWSRVEPGDCVTMMMGRELKRVYFERGTDEKNLEDERGHLRETYDLSVLVEVDVEEARSCSETGHGLHGSAEGVDEARAR